jgi:putative SOS response-associated peptidase YedK
VAPTQEAGVVIAGEAGPRFETMRWGLIPFWAKDPAIGGRLINARCETLREKAAFKHALSSRRCVVPVSGFYEWQRVGRGKQPWYISGAHGRPLGLAGLWERWNDRLTFSIVTVPANEMISSIHDRMPAILMGDDIWNWLSTGDVALLKPAPADALIAWPVSARVNSPANNDARLIEGDARDGGSDQDQSVTRPAQLTLAV